MKVALVHELLTMKGGAERVLRVLAAMYPDTPIYTLLYDEKKLGDWFPKERVRTSKMQKWANPIPNFQFSIFNFQ
ncbi:glycosyltransferase family 4 protein, partial [Candidatus Peregrinibacteria bacterium]|nr:glycosyltransferase family 4 protein [Candidatus Peregrinibacteria bacterium]